MFSADADVERSTSAFIFGEFGASAPSGVAEGAGDACWARPADGPQASAAIKNNRLISSLKV